VFQNYGKSIHRGFKYLTSPEAHAAGRFIPAIPKLQCPLARRRKKKNEPRKIVEDEFKEFDDNLDRVPGGFFEKRFEQFFERESKSTSNLYNVNNDGKRVAKDVPSIKKASEAPQAQQQAAQQHQQPEATATAAASPAREPTEAEKEVIIDEAIRNLAAMVGELEFQMGVESILAGNFSSAVDHFELSRNHQHAGGIFNLALCYEQGLGVKKNLRAARNLYELASTLGHATASYNLGIFFAQGIGGASKNFQEAKKYFQLAAKLGNEEAVEALTMLVPASKKLPVMKELPELDEFPIIDDNNHGKFMSTVSAMRNSFQQRIAVS